VLAFELQDEVPAVKLDGRHASLIVVDVDACDEQFDRGSVARV